MKKVIDKDLGWKRIQKELKLIDKSYTTIGVHEGEENEDGRSLAEIGKTHEFGDRGRKIPQRSFIRVAMNKNIRKTNKVIARAYDKILGGELSVKKALGIMGEWGVKIVVDRINSIRTPPLALSTILQKGSSKPLIDTGQLRQSIDHKEYVR